MLTTVVPYVKAEEYSGAHLASSVRVSVGFSGYEIGNKVAVVLISPQVPFLLLFLQASCDSVSVSAHYLFNEFLFLPKSVTGSVPYLPVCYL